MVAFPAMPIIITLVLGRFLAAGATSARHPARSAVESPGVTALGDAKPGTRPGR